MGRVTHPSLELTNVSLRFRLHYEQAHTLKETLVHFMRGKGGYKDLWAVKDVSLKVGPGESVGIIGRNGCGKSTLLKVMAGVLDPTMGAVKREGSVSALIELGAGFNAELTGRENVFLSGAIMGLSKADMKARYDRIVDFAELHEFMDTPIKNYSSGMYARLGFALATDVDGDILLIDEVLAVGDEAFQQKSMRRIESLLGAGKPVVFVSHDAAAVKRICTRALVMHHGEPRFEGPTDDALAAYREILAHEPGHG